jgi:hypothetical protein
MRVLRGSVSVDYARLGDEISLHVKIATQGGGCLERKNKDTEFDIGHPSRLSRLACEQQRI